MWLLSFLGITNVSGHAYAFWSGAGSDIGELAIVGGLIDVARRGVKHHRERLAQTERHHLEAQAQATAQHNDLKQQAARQHQQVLDQAEAHHEGVKAHLTATMRLPARAPRKPAGNT